MSVRLSPLGGAPSCALAAVLVPSERADVLVATAAAVHLHVEGLSPLDNRHQLVLLSALQATTSESLNLRLPSGVVNEGSGRSPRRPV